MKAIDELTEEEMTRRGEILAEALRLKRIKQPKNNWDDYSTTWGSKTPLGLFRMVARIIQDGE